MPPKLNVRRGWVVLEVISAMFIMSALAAVLVASTRADQIGLTRLSESRALTRVAEATLTAMQNGQPPTAPDPAAQIAVRELATPADLPKMSWVQVKATDTRHTSALVGLIPKTSLAGWIGGTP